MWKGYSLCCSLGVAISFIDVFVMVVFVLVVFGIVYCQNIHDIAPHWATDAEALISWLAVVQEGSPKD